MAPSQLAITTSSINRLLKEESSYRTELSNQQKRLETLGRGVADEADEGNSDFQLKQEKQAIEETKAVFGPLRERIVAAVEKVEGILAAGGSNDAVEMEAAKEAVSRAKAIED